MDEDFDRQKVEEMMDLLEIQLNTMEPSYGMMAIMELIILKAPAGRKDFLKIFDTLWRAYEDNK